MVGGRLKEAAIIARSKWHHLQIVDGRYFVDGVLSTKAKYGGMARRVRESHPAEHGGNWALVKPGAK